MENKEYWVWYDPEINEILGIEKIYITDRLIEQLNKENIPMTTIVATNLKEANKLYLKDIEKLNNHLVMPTYSENLTINSCETNEDDIDDLLERLLLDTKESKKNLKH